MRKLGVAIIGQGRSGKNIHGDYFLSDRNKYYDVKYVAEIDRTRQTVSTERYVGCKVFSDYKEFYGCEDIDLVVNASFSDQHYAITKDLLEHGKNVLVEKPMARTEEECRTLIETAKKKGVLLATFQNTQLAPYYLYAINMMKNGMIGDVKQVSLRFNSLSRRWDWQTLLKRVGGSAYNTGPHPIAMALGFLDFDKNTQVVFSKLDTALTSGDADDYVKIVLTAPNKPVVDVEISSIDPFTDYNIKLQGSKGAFKSTPKAYKCRYIADGDNPPRPVIEEPLRDEKSNPLYCSEKLITRDEEGTFDGTAFDVGTGGIYELTKTMSSEKDEKT